MRDMLVVLLEGQRYAVSVARSGEQALDMMGKSLPDLVLLDLMLPSITGWDVLRQIRDNHPYLPVIMLTGRGEAVDRVVGLELGADDYVVKPFHPRELLARIGAVLRRTRRPDTEEEEALASMDASSRTSGRRRRTPSSASGV